MTAIALIYNKNTTGEEYPPPNQIRITYTRPDGRQATGDDVSEIQLLFSRAMAQANVKRRNRTAPVEPVWSEGGYQIEIERDDGLPMRLDEVQCYLLDDAMRRFNAVEDVEVVTTPKATLAAVTGLPLLGVQAWAAAVQQLEPDSEKQIVTLVEPEGAQQLLDAGLVERYDGGAENQYTIPWSAAYCKVELRRRNVD